MTDTVPDVSVVIPAYHAEVFIARAIQSVLDQPSVDPEIIVVVDGLVDRTADIARGFPKTQVVINEVNRGASAARNRGLALARAPYVMFLDADDWVEGPLLEGLMEALDVFEADIAFGACRHHYESGKPPYIKSLRTGNEGNSSESNNNRELIILLLMGSFINTCATMWKVNYIRKNGAWNEDILNSEDSEIVFRYLFRGARCALTSKGEGVYYEHISSYRLTAQLSDARWQSQVLARSLIIEEAKSSGCFDTSIKRALVRYLRYNMRAWARHGDHDSYRQLIKLLKELGDPQLNRIQLDGGVAHRLGCLLLGLRRKEQLSLRISGMKKLFSG